MKGFVMLTDPAKPLPRASKDTAQRHAVFKLYEAGWKPLYECLARFNQTSKEPVVQSSVSPGKPHDNPSQTVDSAGLSDKTILAIEAIVEQKISAALNGLHVHYWQPLASSIPQALPPLTLLHKK
jgi:hypothetical protein